MQSLTCPQCGLANLATASQCLGCAQPFAVSAALSVESPAPLENEGRKNGLPKLLVGGGIGALLIILLTAAYGTGHRPLGVERW